jgi:hypothetical protein
MTGKQGMMRIGMLTVTQRCWTLTARNPRNANQIIE